MLAFCGVGSEDVCCLLSCRCATVLGVKQISVRVDEGLLRRVKFRALEEDASLTEVVTRLLADYAAPGESVGRPVAGGDPVLPVRPAEPKPVEDAVSLAELLAEGETDVPKLAEAMHADIEKSRESFVDSLVKAGVVAPAKTFRGPDLRPTKKR